MRTADIRTLFLEYFESHGHRVVPSSPLVPGNDPTLLFTNAGMVQFKDVFLGLDKRDYNRAVTAQRCVRAGGKHNDLENVGYTARHHTFFEMLGNFSFGDYFKRDAIHYAWNLLTARIGLPADRLWATVYDEDDEAASIWLDEIGVPPERFARIGAHDNFWAMGDTGPCGPCSEIFYDHGPSVAGGPPGTPEADGDRYVEIWNLVFMQFNRGEDGSMEPLPRPSVDTGMGLERLAAVLQGVHSTYDTDLFRILIEAAASAVGSDDLKSHSLRVIADHVRSTSFLIADGVIPSNEGRGYVLRRIIRRAVRHGFRLGAEEPFLHRLVAPLSVEMGEAYPELLEASERVARTLRQEEERFAVTLDQGLKILAAEMEHLSGSVIPGALVFKLYDTYGFPVDLTADVARERNMTIDQAGFERAMDEQRERARAASRFVMGARHELSVTEATEFTGYRELGSDGTVVLLLKDDREVDSAGAGDDVVVILDRTPFYAESGGQIGDRGRLRSADTVVDVNDVRQFPNRVAGHCGRVRMGTIRVGERVEAEVDGAHRADTANNHSATHLLHAALKRVLGDHVQQKGSLVAPDRLRFDFSHSEPVKKEVLRTIEAMVNAEIRADHAVETEVMALEAARKAGAAALFGEKYDERVRVVGMGEFSLELCGGTHVARTGQIGLFKIIQETGIAAGVRRIEAVTGRGALEFVDNRVAIVDRIAAALKCTPDELEAKAAQNVRRVRELERRVEELQGRLATGGGSDPAAAAREIAGVKVLALRQDGVGAGALRQTMDQLRDRLGSGVVVVGGAHEHKAQLVAGVSGDMADRIGAGDLIRELAPMVGGKGGGKAQMAQGGGPDVASLDAALDQVYLWVQKTLE